MAQAGLVWKRTPSTMLDALVNDYIARIRQAVLQVAQYYAAQIEAWMKQNAPWTDRTSNARQTLSAEVEQLSLDMFEIVLAGGVDYFVWLELGHAGRFAIIGPALDLWGPRVWADIRLLLS